MAANHAAHFHFLHSSSLTPNSPTLVPIRNPNLVAKFYVNFKLSSSRTETRDGFCSLSCFCKPTSDVEVFTGQEETERPKFDISLAVILAGFAFEAYTSPPENVGRREVDAAGCQTVILSELFLREIYDGQLFVKLKKGYDFPAMDPWGTSDPYVVMELDSQIVKSKVKWGTKEPTWNEELTLYIKHPPTKNLQVAAWDANLVTPHKRMGNSSVSLDSLCDGNSHEVLVDLEGMGGGGKLQLEVEYKSFDRIEEESNRWRIPIVSEFLRNSGFETALRKVVGSEPVQAREFVEYAFRKVKSFNDAYSQRDGSSISDEDGGEETQISSDCQSNTSHLEGSREGSPDSERRKEDVKVKDVDSVEISSDIEQASSVAAQTGVLQSDKDFWKNFGDTIHQNVVKQLGLPAPEIIKWEGFDLLNMMGLQSRSIAEAGYVEAGLATPSGQDANKDNATTNTPTFSTAQSSFPDIKRVTQDLLRQTDSILGSLMVLNATVTELTKDGGLLGKSGSKDDVNKEEEISSEYPKSKISESSSIGPVLDEQKAEEMKALFSTAESAMEAWAMLATSLGHPSFIKSEFEKICFLDNSETDTQVAIWRDSRRRRLVVAFRGTEQVRWKDLRTDLMLAPAGLNPERIGGNFKQEIQVHTGFLNAYDSVRNRIISLIKAAIAYQEDADQVSKWHVYVTGHSLGGALATLLALELSSSPIAKCGAISVTMYNFGSPRLGNKKFAEVYNEKVKDSWRVVNHRDIIPSIPRLMGYCHVAQPVYLAAGDLQNALENIERLGDGYEGDVIGESTPDVLVNEFMKGETELIEKILNTEINFFRSIRDGTALMQHMEDFYYVSLLERVRSNYQTAPKSESGEDSPSAKTA